MCDRRCCATGHNDAKDYIIASITILYLLLKKEPGMLKTHRIITSYFSNNTYTSNSVFQSCTPFINILYYYCCPYIIIFQRHRYVMCC